MNESYNCSNEEPRTADRPSDELVLPDWSGQVRRAPRMPLNQWLEYCRSHLSELRRRPGYAQRRRQNGIPVEFSL
jgi:hypothetical protein